MEFKGVKIIWACFRDAWLYLIHNVNIPCGYLLVVFHRGTSKEYPNHVLEASHRQGRPNEYPKHIFMGEERIKKNIKIFWMSTHKIYFQVKVNRYMHDSFWLKKCLILKRVFHYFYYHLHIVLILFVHNLY